MAERTAAQQAAAMDAARRRERFDAYFAENFARPITRLYGPPAPMPAPPQPESDYVIELRARYQDLVDEYRAIEADKAADPDHPFGAGNPLQAQYDRAMDETKVLEEHMLYYGGRRVKVFPK